MVVAIGFLITIIMLIVVARAYSFMLWRKEKMRLDRIFGALEAERDAVIAALWLGTIEAYKSMDDDG